MHSILQRASVALLLCVVSAGVEAQSIAAPEAYRTAIQLGYVSMADEPALIELTVARRKELQRVNRWVNSTIAYRPEQVDTWTLSSYEGDCEDYVIAKIDALVRRGWSRGALRIVYVTTEQGEGHAVLAVTAPSSILILDNRVPYPASVSAFVRAGYIFHSWEIPGNPTVWELVKGNLLFITALAGEKP